MDENQLQSKDLQLEARAREMPAPDNAVAAWVPRNAPPQCPAKIHREYIDVKEEARDRH
jgi:hypothetical protein